MLRAPPIAARHGRTQADWKSSDLPRYPELYLLIGVKLTHVTALARSARDDTVIQRSAITSYPAAIEDGKQPIRFVRTIKESCLERMIFFGETSLRKAIAEFVAHYHLERNHQGLGNRLIVPIEATGETAETVQRRQRLGGMLNYYYREAA